MLAGMGKKFYKERFLTEKRKLDDFKTCRLGDRPGPQVARTAAAAPLANTAPVAAVRTGTKTKGAAGSSVGNNNRKR